MPNLPTIEIDEASGFCFGVTTAISKAEDELRRSGSLYCLAGLRGKRRAKMSWWNSFRN